MFEWINQNIVAGYRDYHLHRTHEQRVNGAMSELGRHKTCYSISADVTWSCLLSLPYFHLLFAQGQLF